MKQEKRVMLSAVLLLVALTLFQSVSFLSSNYASSSYHAPTPSESVVLDKYDVCVVGAGLSGAVLAERYASQLKQTVLVVDKRSHIGGNCFDYIDEDTGLRVSQYGAHLFHTKYGHVWEYVKQFGEWVDYEHKVRGIVNGKSVPIPVNIETVNTLFDLSIQNSAEMDAWLKKEQIPVAEDTAKNSEEIALSRVGRRLYNLIFRPYTIKQWAKDPSQLGPEVLSRIPVRNNHDDRYFSDEFQALPKEGYTAIFERMLASHLINVKTEIDYFKVRDRLRCGKTYYTGPIDTYFADTGWPKLEYRSLDFERVVENVDRKLVDNVKGVSDFYFQEAFVVNHPQSSANFTRIVEYKHLPNQPTQSDSKRQSTVYFIERSQDGGEPYYPVPNEKNKALYRKYQELAQQEPEVTFVGRLANYKYFNMDEAIKNALFLFEKDTGIPYPSVGPKNQSVPLAHNAVTSFTSHIAKKEVCGLPWKDFLAGFTFNNTSMQPLLWTVSGGEEYRQHIEVLLQKWEKIEPSSPMLVVALDEATAQRVCSLGHMAVYWNNEAESYSRVADAKFRPAAEWAYRGIDALFVELDVFCKMSPFPLLTNPEEGVDLVTIGHGGESE